jgi:porin
MWQINETSDFLAAVYDGEPTNFKDNPHNISWDLKKKDGFLFFGEWQKKLNGNLPGCIKAGAYLHQHFFDDEYDFIDSNSVHRNNYGFYLLGEKELWHQQQSNRTLAAFIQTGLSPKKINANAYYIGLGLNFYGIINRNGEDVAGIAIAHDVLRGAKGNETTLEASYQVPLLQKFFIQPDIQYVINPSGTDRLLDNALVLTFRFGMNL